MKQIITTYEQYEVNVGLATIALSVEQGVVKLDNMITKLLSGKEHSIKVREAA